MIRSTIQALPGQLHLMCTGRVHGAELPAVLAFVALLDICCCERDLAHSLELEADLPVQFVFTVNTGSPPTPLLQAPA